MPQLGETVTEGTITRWMKSVGDQVDRDEPLFEVSTDKVDSEVPAPASGVLSEILVPEGETVAVGARLAVIADGAGGVATSAPGTPVAEAQPQAPAPEPAAPPEPDAAPAPPPAATAPPAPSAPPASAAPPAPPPPASPPPPPPGGFIPRAGEEAAPPAAGDGTARSAG